MSCAYLLILATPQILPLPFRTVGLGVTAGAQSLSPNHGIVGLSFVGLSEVTFNKTTKMDHANLTDLNGIRTELIELPPDSPLGQAMAGWR